MSLVETKHVDLNRLRFKKRTLMKKIGERYQQAKLNPKGYHTIMAYPKAPYSNTALVWAGPNVDYNGTKSGSAAADAVGTLSGQTSLRPHVSGFRF